MKKWNGMLIATLVPFFSFILLFMCVPLLFMLLGSFQVEGGGGWTLDHYAEIFGNPYYTQALQNSMLIACWSAVMGIMVSVFAAYGVTKFPKYVQERILVLTNLTSNFAGIPLAFAFIVLLGNSGLFTLLFRSFGIDLGQSFNLYSWGGLTVIYVYFQLPLGILLLYPIYHGIQEQWKEAATLLGASSYQFWLRIGAPMLLPSIAGTFSIMFANAMGAYATAYALTGSTYNLVPIRISNLVSGDVFARPELGSALATALGLTLVTALLLNEWLTRRIRRDLR
ncbi:ABC transporter permease [Paenibacillus sp. 481]|uniref:ABC transporter permease n=1 Tax=Paenibacillus sp. 481 TaxID=2835869 RepID=UPI001E578B07|nr:ABC transporter permease subunit [Paenibacillus sp. 481]UHA74554.1 ABC transporter permease [Paenibacillus sp. 481]